MIETSISSKFTFTRETGRKFKSDRIFLEVDNNYLNVKNNQNILINSSETGFFALTKKGESVTVNELKKRLIRSVSKYQNAGEIPFDFNINLEVMIIRQTFSEFNLENWSNVGEIKVSRFEAGTIIDGVKVGGRFIKFGEENN